MTFAPPMDTVQLARTLAESRASDVGMLAARIDQTAEAVRQEASVLRRVGSDSGWLWSGDAADAFAEANESLPRWLDRVYDRFAGVAAALRTVAAKQDEFAGRARVALNKLDHATDLARTAQRAADRATEPDAQARAKDDKDRANDDERYWTRELEHILEEWEAVARAQATIMRDACDDLDDPTGLGSIGTAAHKLADGITDIPGLELIETVLDVTSMVLVVAMFVPGLQPFVAPALLAVAAVSLTIDAAQAYEGEGSWTDAGMSALDVATAGVASKVTTSAKAIKVVGALDDAADAADTANTAINVAQGDATLTDVALTAVGMKLRSRGRSVPAKTPSANWAADLPDPHVGVREASQALRNAGVPRDARLKILNAFEKGTIRVRHAGADEYAMRFYDNVDSFPKGSWLLPTLPALRDETALRIDWNQMTHMQQWRIRPDAPVIEGHIAPQGVGYPGGGMQLFVLNPKADLLMPS